MKIISFHSGKRLSNSKKNVILKPTYSSILAKQFWRMSEAVSSTRMRLHFCLRSTNGWNKETEGLCLEWLYFVSLEDSQIGHLGVKLWLCVGQTAACIFRLIPASDQQLEKQIYYGIPELIVLRLQINIYQTPIILSHVGTSFWTTLLPHTCTK